MKKNFIIICCLLTTFCFYQKAISQAVPVIHVSNTCLTTATTSITITVSNYPPATNFTLIHLSGSNCLTTGSYTTGSTNSFPVPINSSATFGTGTFLLYLAGTSDSVAFTITYLPTPGFSMVPGCLRVGMRGHLDVNPTCSGCSYNWAATNATLTPATGSFVSCVAHASSATVIITYSLGTCSVSSAPINVANCNARPEYNASDDIAGTINIFPNPSVGKFTLDIPTISQKAFADLYDITGKALREITLNQGANNIDVTWLPNGEYNLIIWIDNKSYPKKIIIAK